jgi:hypothetical protein
LQEDLFYPSFDFKATLTMLMSREKPVPTIVKMSPPRALAMFGVTEVSTKGILMSATPAANGIRPLESLISAL